jgi:hypothetical protein
LLQCGLLLVDALSESLEGDDTRCHDAKQFH